SSRARRGRRGRRVRRRQSRKIGGAPFREDRRTERSRQHGPRGDRDDATLGARVFSGAPAPRARRPSENRWAMNRSFMNHSGRTRSPINAPYAYAWLFEHARATGAAPCIGTPSGWTSYADLASRVRTLRASLASRGVGHADIVVNALIDG